MTYLNLLDFFFNVTGYINLLGNSLIGLAKNRYPNDGYIIYISLYISILRYKITYIVIYPNYSPLLKRLYSTVILTCV